jgi:histidinol phosphatase-like enzyme
MNIIFLDMDGVVNSEEYLVDKILENINIDITQ